MWLIFSFGQQKEGDPISKKVSLYTKGNNIQYPMISHNGKEDEKECIYIYHWITLLHEVNIVNQLYFNNVF